MAMMVGKLSKERGSFLPLPLSVLRETPEFLILLVAASMLWLEELDSFKALAVGLTPILLVAVIIVLRSQGVRIWL
jgi:hypothetical protein